MAFHVRDPKTDALVRELARRRGIGVTEAVREAVTEALAGTPDEASAERRVTELRRRLQPLFDRLDALPRSGIKLDKQFFDDLWGQGEDDPDAPRVSLGEAVHRAVGDARAAEDNRLSLWERTADLRERMETLPLTGRVADKRFFDSLSGQEDG